MEHILEITGLSNHPLGLERKAYVENLVIDANEFRVSFFIKYFKDGVEFSSESLSVKPQRFATDSESYATLLTIQADANYTTYQNILGLIDAQVRSVIEEGRTD